VRLERVYRRFYSDGKVVYTLEVAMGGRFRPEEEPSGNLQQVDYRVPTSTLLPAVLGQLVRPPDTSWADQRWPSRKKRRVEEKVPLIAMGSAVSDLIALATAKHQKDGPDPRLAVIPGPPIAVVEWFGGTLTEPADAVRIASLTTPGCAVHTWEISIRPDSPNADPGRAVVWGLSYKSRAQYEKRRFLRVHLMRLHSLMHAFEVATWLGEKIDPLSTDPARLLLRAFLTNTREKMERLSADAVSNLGGELSTVLCEINELVAPERLRAIEAAEEVCVRLGIELPRQVVYVNTGLVGAFGERASYVNDAKGNDELPEISATRQHDNDNMSKEDASAGEQPAAKYVLTGNAKAGAVGDNATASNFTQGDQSPIVSTSDPATALNPGAYVVPARSL
jgi:hypothetical protein